MNIYDFLRTLPHTKPWIAEMLTRNERKELLAIAREAAVRAVRHQEWRIDAPRGALEKPGGAFVTLRKHGELRGCIGYIESKEPLAEVVAEVAVKAALEDPRFPPVTEDELAEIAVEVSVLSPMRRVAEIEEIRVGEHGLLLERGWNRGLLLPQVASEYHWDRKQFLEQTARKAGLPADAWRDPQTKLFCFSAEVFDEEHAD